MKRFALPVCVAAALAAGAAVPAHAAEHGWYIGTGIGYSKGSVSNDTLNDAANTVNALGGTVNSITKGENSFMYQLFLGYSFTSFLALEANAFRLGEFSFNADISPVGNVQSSLDMWGGSVDVLGIIPLGDSWRIFGRAGAIVVKSTANFGAPSGIPDQEETKFGWKLGAGVGYEFESGVAFRAEYNYYLVDTAWDAKVNTQVISGTVLYRFK